MSHLCNITEAAVGLKTNSSDEALNAIFSGVHAPVNNDVNRVALGPAHVWDWLIPRNIILSFQTITYCCQRGIAF